MKKFVYIAGLLLLIAIPAYLYLSPYIAIYMIKQAVERQDYGHLSQYVDYDELRNNLKNKAGQVAERITSGTAAGGTATGIEKSLKKSLIEQAVEQLITPENAPLIILQIMAQKERRSAPSAGERQGVATAPNSPGDFLRSAEFGYRSFNTFAVKIKPGEQRPAVFILTRKGLQWKLTDIDL